MNKLFISVSKQLYKPASTTNWIMFNFIKILTLFCPLALARVGGGGVVVVVSVCYHLFHLDLLPCLLTWSAVSTTLITAV